MSAGGDWRPVTRAKRCPVCEKPDWCCVTIDGAACCCMRTESPKLLCNGGWLHRLRDNGTGWRPRPRVRSVTVSAPRSAGRDFVVLAKAVDPFALIRFAGELGVDRTALMRLGIGWDGAAWIFPMRDAGRRIIGIRRRFPNGRKLCVTGSKTGLFIPSGLSQEQVLLICEGESDCAALLTLGFDAIGRPSCTGGVEFACSFARGRSVVVVGDDDEAGQRGAEVLARALRLHTQSVRTIQPAIGKDVREWVERGATQADVRTAIDRAEPVGLEITTNAAGC